MYYGMHGRARLLRVIRRHRALPLFLLLFILLAAIPLYGHLVSECAAEALSVRARDTISRAVAETCENYMKENAAFADTCFSPVLDGERITGYSLSSEVLAEAERAVSEELSTRLKACSRVRVGIPSGSLSGIAAFSGHGIPVYFSASMISAVRTAPESSIESVGINHTLYRASLRVTVTCELVISGHSESFSLEFEKLIAEKVILGDVPLTN